MAKLFGVLFVAIVCVFGLVFVAGVVSKGVDEVRSNPNVQAGLRVAAEQAKKNGPEGDFAGVVVALTSAVALTKKDFVRKLALLISHYDKQVEPLTAEDQAQKDSAMKMFDAVHEHCGLCGYYDCTDVELDPIGCEAALVDADDEGSDDDWEFFHPASCLSCGWQEWDCTCGEAKHWIR